VIGRVAILAGAAGELGRATAQNLTGAGFTVVGIDRNEHGLKEMPDGIRYEVGDPTDPAVARSLVEETTPFPQRGAHVDVDHVPGELPEPTQPKEDPP
jgi:NAD(P)-dependent dehydrogenase (short-subunit alcohol dehydrogenase family)